MIIIVIPISAKQPTRSGLRVTVQMQYSMTREVVVSVYNAATLLNVSSRLRFSKNTLNFFLSSGENVSLAMSSDSDVGVPPALAGSVSRPRGPPGGGFRCPGPGFGGPPIWVGSWGSAAGLGRVARLADGWLASAYNTTPQGFAKARADLADRLRAAGRDADAFPNTLGTMWLYLTENAGERANVLERISGLLHREVDELADLLPIGPSGHCADIVARYVDAGVERIIFWPLTDEVRQLERLAGEVLS